LFIYCFSNELKDKLIACGYKMINKPSKDYWVFINNRDLKFDFSCVEQSSFKFMNKLTF